jgi:transcriptional regulator with XRE-family HTH domain
METSNAKASFAARLTELCEDMGVAEWGRLRVLGKLFGVSPQAAKKWLDGQAFPSTETVLAIAAWGRVNINWLLQGQGPKLADAPAATITAAEGIEELPETDKQQVLEFMLYKFHQPQGWFAEERLARLDAALDEIQKKPN